MKNKKLILISAGILLIVTSVIVGAYFLINSNNNQPQSLIDGPKQVFYIGDSITAGTSSIKYSDLLTDQYTNITQEINLAVSGSVVEDLPEQISKLKNNANSSYEDIIIHGTIGGNNILALLALNPNDRGLELEKVKQEYTSIIEDLSSHFETRNGDEYYIQGNLYNPSDELELSGICRIFARGDYTAKDLNDLINNWNSYLFDLDQQYDFLTVVDLKTPFFTHGLNFAQFPNSELWFSDCIHPNDKGHTVIADLFYNTAKELE